MPTDIVRRAASAVKRSSVIIAPLIRQIDSVIYMDENRLLLENRLSRAKDLLFDIRNEFEDQHKRTPDTVRNCLERMEVALENGRNLMDRSQRQKQKRFGWLLCNPKLSREIRDWKTEFDELFQELQSSFLLSANAPQTEELQEYGLFGSGILSAQFQLQRWLTESPHVRLIVVYGLGGIGKTALLRTVYESRKCSAFFHDLIWVTVSQSYTILDLQSCIAQRIKLGLPSNSDVNKRKMELSAYFKNKKFLLILDDVWSVVNLKYLGLEFAEGNDYNGSKVVFSTRNRDLIVELNADEAMRIQPLSSEDGWELFCRVAFKDVLVPHDTDEHTARQVAAECKGLPLPINVVAASMIGKTDVDEWKLLLSHMKAIPNFPTTHPRLDPDLYQQLRWSYDSLPNVSLRNCFLYCALFPKDEIIEVDNLVGMWISEGLVSMDRGRSSVQLLVDSYLFEPHWGSHEDRLLQSGKHNFSKVTVNNVLHEMAIYIGEKEENCVFKAGQMLQEFPYMEAHEYCKRISVFRNKITSMPRELRCPRLVSLILTESVKLEHVSEAFFQNLAFLRVLDLSKSPIKLLPSSLWQLKELEFLNLSSTEIEHVPEAISNLSRLQVLDLSACTKLKSLPSEIGELVNLKHLYLDSCDSLSEIPDELSRLSNGDCSFTRFSSARIEVDLINVWRGGLIL